MAASIPRQLMAMYEGRIITGGLYSLSHFKIDGSVYNYPRFEGCSFVREEWEINISNNTQLTLLTPTLNNSFPVYPMTTSIISLLLECSEKKMLIDVVGKIIHGELQKNQTCAYKIFLQDHTGYVIKMILIETPVATFYDIPVNNHKLNNIRTTFKKIQLQRTTYYQHTYRRLCLIQ